MSSEPPPNPLTSTFNVADWIQDAAGITQAKANLLYLRKTVQDVDPFQATFSGNIKTNNIDTISATGASNCALFTGATNAVIDLGPTTQPVGHSALIRLGLANSTIQCGSGTGSLVIQKLESFGGLTNSIYNDSINPINLGLTSSAIQIGTSQIATNTIGIGSASTALSSLGTNTLGPLKVNTINPTTTSGTIQIGQTATNTNVEIAAQASRSTTLHLGDGDTSSGAVHINNGLSASGNVQILNGAYTGTQVKGSVNICTGTASSLTTGGAVNIHTGTTASNCTIGNINSKLNVDCAMDVLTLANSTPSINILSGTVGAGVAGGSVSILSGNHNATSTGSNFNLMNNNCKGTATIGNALSTTTINSGTINLGTVGTSITTVNGTFYPLKVLAPSEYGAKFNPVFGAGGKGNINIGGNFPSIPGDTGPRRVCDIYGGFSANTWGTEYMSLGVGYGGATNDGGAPTIEQVRISGSTITLNKPITPAYSPTTLVAGQIGHTTEVIIPVDIVIGFADNIVSTLTIGTAGVYIINYSYRLNGNNSVVILCESWFNTSTQTSAVQYANQSVYYNPAVIVGSIICQAGSAVITTTATSTITFHIFVDKTGANLSLINNYSYYSYTRIA